MKTPIDVVLSCDAGFFPGLLSTATSIALHDREHDLKIHLLDGGLSEVQWKYLAAHVSSISPRAFMVRHVLNQARLASFQCHSELGLMTYARILVPEFVEADFAIYVDSDILVTQPLGSLEGLFADDKAVYGAPELGMRLADDCPWGTGQNLSAYPYINGGFLVMNLRKWRADGISRQLWDFLEKESPRCKNSDQSAINWLLRDDIGLLPKEWNVLSASLDSHLADVRPGAGNIHYASGLKPWKRPLPTLSHRIWNLFERRWIPADARTHPLRQPNNLARYLKAFRPSAFVRQNNALRQWEQFWDTFHQ